MHFHGRRITSFLKTVFTLALCGIVSLAPVACAKYHVPIAGQSVSLGTIGVVSAKFVPEVDIDMPATGFKGQAISRWEGLKGGVKKGGEVGMLGGLGVGGLGCIVTGPFWGLCAFAVMLSGGILGGVGGGVTGGFSSQKGILSEQETEQVKGIINQSFVELHMQENLRKHFLAVARERTTHHLNEELKFGPTTKDEKLSYLPLQEKEINTILELSVLSLGMAGQSSVDPQLTLSMTAKGRLIRAVDGAILKEMSFTHISDPQLFSSWAVNRAENFRKELENAYQKLAEKFLTNFLQTVIR